MVQISYNEELFESCSYSDRLLNKLKTLNHTSPNKVNLSEIKKAIYIARKFHGEQKRESGEPYYSHPLEVAYMVADYLFKTEYLITSILHDTLEDTKLTQGMIEELFNKNIAQQVEGLTRIKQHGKISSAELVEILWQQKEYELLLIKQFDRLHNMLTINAKSPEKIKKITKETFETFILLAAFLGIPNVEEQLIQICQNISNSQSITIEELLPFGSDQDLLALLSQNDATHK
jgi:guanosine-3',5'-bis(diphosphate) 3'-pyrophosphohydrolase